MVRPFSCIHFMLKLFILCYCLILNCRDIWQVFLDKKEFALAKSYCQVNNYIL